jgi:hypothetical protein
MEVQFAVAKIGKYAISESGDTLEMIERPHGGLSFVLESVSYVTESPRSHRHIAPEVEMSFTGLWRKIVRASLTTEIYAKTELE